MKKVDSIFHYQGFGDIPSHCRIQIFEMPEYTIVVASEMENSGTSVTNLAENIATLVMQEYKINFDRLFWIEHYPVNLGISTQHDTFQLVTFQQKGDGLIHPEWISKSKEEVEKLISEKLTD